jgi:uncharacterized Tic20 family protein
MAAYHIRLIGGVVIWVFKGFKTSFKDCINNFTLSFIIGIITILILFYFGIYLYSGVNP